MNNKSKQQILRMETYAKFPYLIEISHEEYGVFRYANSTEDITYNGNVYSSSWFEISPPERKDNSIGNASLTISSIDQFWISKIRDTDIRAKIKFIAVIEYTDDMNIECVEPMDELDFELTKSSWDGEFSISWTMEFDDGMSIVVPCDKATSQKVPACK